MKEKLIIIEIIIQEIEAMIVSAPKMIKVILEEILKEIIIMIEIDIIMEMIDFIIKVEDIVLEKEKNLTIK
jgi:hypothetical protein